MYTASFCCRNVSFMLKINMVVLFVLVSILSAWFKTASAESEEADPCQGRVGIFPNPDDCTTYLICQNGISEIANCPDGLLFDRYKRTCDRNVTVDCSDAGASDLPPYQTGVRSDDVVCESDNCSCIYPSKTSCSQYYRCEDGIAYLEQCSEGLLMNPETLTCDYAEDVSCAVSAEVEQEDPCQGKVGVFSNPDDCTTYLICQNGISEIVSCPDGLLFDRYKRTCDRNATVACSDAGATDLPPYQTGVRSDDVVCESNNCSCIYPSNTSCSQYYRCEDGIAYVEQCSEGLLMNPETLTCDYAEDVTCGISPSYDTSSPTITAYYLSSGSDLDDDNEILSSTIEEEINDESNESTLYPTSEITSVIGQSTFMDGNTGNDLDENEIGTTMILTSEAEFSGNTIGDDVVTPSESYSLSDSTDGMALTGIPGNGTFSQPSTAMPDNITSEDGTSTSFAQTERDLLTTVMSTIKKYFSDEVSETTSEAYPATKEETSENDLKTDVQSDSTSESITFTSMPYKTPVNAESTLSVSSTLSPAITGESTVMEISSAITTGESESYFDSEKTSSENGQITEQYLTPELKSTSIDDISESTIRTSQTEFIKSEDNFAQETTSSGITDSSVNSTSPVSVVYRSTDSELSFDDTTANDNSVYTKDSSTISHDIVELSTLHINQTQNKNTNEIKDASNLPVNFNVTTTPEETSTRTIADEGRSEITTESEIMTNVPSLEITDSSEKEHFGTDAINETADNVFDTTTNFVDLTSETQNPFATSETYVTKLTSPSKETSQTNTTGSQDTSAYSDLIDSNPTSVIFTTESIASTGTNDSNTETATLQTVSEIRNDTITSDSASSSPTVSFTSETASELSTATENKVQYTSTDIDKETKEMESIATNIISTTAGHIDLTSKFTEISSETPAPTTTFATKLTALPVRSSSFSTGSETEISTNTHTEAFTSETASENPTEKTRISDSVSNLRTEPFTSETAPKRSTVNEITEYTTPTEADIISSVETSGETVIDSTTKVTETTSVETFTQNSTTVSSVDNTETVIYSIPTTTEHFIDSTAELTEVTSQSQNPTSAMKLTTPSQETSTYAELETSTNTQSPKITLITKTSASDVVTPSNEAVSETRPKTLTSNSVTNFPSDSFTSESMLESITAANIRTTFSKETAETESVDTSSVPLTTKNFLDFTTEFTEVTSETQNPTFIPDLTKFTERTSSIITESETSTSTVTEPTINPSASENTDSVVVTETRTEASTPETVTETSAQTFPSNTTPDLHTESFTSETSSELSRTADNITQHTTLSRQSTETESSTVSFASTITEQFIDSTTDFTEMTSRSQDLTSVIKFTASSLGSSTIVTESEANNLMTTHSNASSTVSDIMTESRTETSSSDAVTVTQTKTVSPETASETSMSNLRTDLFTSETATETSSTGKTKVTSESTVTESVISSLPTTISLPTSVITSTVSFQGSSTNGSETRASTNMGTLTSTVKTATSDEVTEASTESATLETMTEAQSKTSRSDLVSNLPTESLISETVPQSTTVSEDQTQYATTHDTGPSSENGSSTITSVSMATGGFTDFTTELPDLISETGSSESITKFIVPSQGISNTVTDSETNSPMITQPITITSITRSTASAVATETRSESATPKIGTKTQTETPTSETESDIFTDPFKTETISEMNSATESSSQYTTKSITGENTETESVSTSVPTIADQFIDSTTEFTEMTSEKQNATSVTKFTATSQGPSGSVTDTEANTSATITPTTESITSAVVTEILPESATPETVTEKRDQMSPETVTDFLTKSFTSETIAESDKPTEDIAQYTTTSGITKNETETESIAVASKPTTAERLVDTTTETKKPVATKFTAPFDRTSSTTAELEIDMLTTEEQISFISTGSTASTTVTETRSETPNLGTITVSQEETVSDFPTKSFTTISERSTSAENNTQYPTKIINTENTETETISILVPTTTERVIDSTIGFTDLTSKTEKSTSVTKSTVTSQGFSSTITEPKGNISMLTEPTNTSTAGSTSAVMTEIRTESATPEIVTETRGEMSPSETVTDFLTKAFTSETDNLTEDITQYTTASSISKTETKSESISITSTPTTAERMIVTTTETEKPIVTKFTAPFERTSSNTEESEIDMSTTEELSSFISTGSTASATVTETRSETPNIGTITVSQKETVSDLPTKSFTAVSERSTPTENITQYTITSISTENTESESVSGSVPATTERLIDSTTEFIEMTSKREKATSVTKSTVTSQEFSSTVTKSEANISTITEPRTITSTAGSTSAVITEIRTESATPESVTETGDETSPSETASDLYTNPVTPKTVTESDDSTEGFTQYTSSDIGKKETESITITSASTTTEQFIDSTTETKKPTVTKSTTPFERTSSITAESKIDISTTIKPTSFIFTTGSTTSAIATETRTGSAIPETVTETRAKTESDLFTKPFTTNSVSDSNTATESITSYTTEDFSRDNTETESVKISSVPTSTDRFVNSTTEFTEITSETRNPPSKFTAPSQQGSSSTATESETNISTTTEPNIVTSTAESTVFSVVTAFSTESATSRTMTETAGETSAFVTMSDLRTQPSTSETASESKYTTKDVTEYTTSDVSRKSIETEPATITTAATTAERFTDSTAEFTDVTSETKNSTETFVTKFTAYKTLSSSESTASVIHTSMNTEPVTKSSTAETSFETITVSPVETSTSETVLETRFQSSTSVTSSESGTVSEVKESITISTMCLDPNGMYPHPTDCQAFYKCTEGVPVLSLCVGDEHFNPRDHLCQDPCLALCDNTIDCSGMTQSPSSVTTEEFSTSANISRTLMTEATSYGTTETDDNASESSFIYTTNVSFPTNEQTNFTNEFSSTPLDNTISSTSIVSEVTAIEDNSTEIEISTLLTSPETFSSFPTTLDIAKTTLSDISSTRSSEEINNSPTSVFSTTRTGPSNFISTTVYDKDNTESPICQDPNGLYPNPNDCRSFIMCIGGEPYETQCDEQLHFSPLTQHCEFPCIAKCDPTLDCSTNPPIATSAIPFIKCPQKDFFPVYEQCDYYFDCVDTFPRIQTCPVGLTFNATTRVCDWPENAECGSSVKPLLESDDSYDCPCETCLVPSMSSCKAYYFCFNYKAYPMECSNGLLFDQSLNTCNYQSKTLCNTASSTITTTSTTTTTAISSSTTQSYKCPERNGMFRDPSNCGRFIHCSNYWPYIKDCPGGLHFSVELQRCEWPCEAKCDLTLPCVATQQTSIPLRLPSTTPDPLCPCKNCRVSNPESCTKYIECTNGVSKRKNCPRGQTFDHQRQRCDWAHKVDCPYSQICPRSNGLFLYKDDCHKFVHCSNGIPYVKTCPGELEFDPRTLRCEWPSGKCVSAKPEFSSRAEEIDEQLFEEKWTCPEKFGYFPHETSCSKFYHCSFGTPHLKECSDDLSYNPLYQTCDWQKNVKCGSHQQHYRRRCRRYDRQILCPQNKTHVAHPHCDMFYDCSTGSPCPKRCPNGLFFNSITHMCDTAENVNCLKRDGEVYSLKSIAETCHRKGKGQMQDPANDSCFYKCHNHKVLRGCCSRNRIFNEKSNNCMLKTFIPQNLRIFG